MSTCSSPCSFSCTSSSMDEDVTQRQEQRPSPLQQQVQRQVVQQQQHHEHDLVRIRNSCGSSSGFAWDNRRPPVFGTNGDPTIRTSTRTTATRPASTIPLATSSRNSCSGSRNAILATAASAASAVNNDGGGGGEGIRPEQPQQRRPSTNNKAKAAAAATTEATRRMVCGGLAGMIAKTATNPLERIKMLSQTGEHSGRSTVIGLYRDIIKNEGVIGLWAGNGVNLIRIFPAKAVVFASNDMYKSTLKQLSGTPHDKPLSGSLSFLAGGLAGMTATACTYPLDFARGRISGKLGMGGKKEYGGIIQTLAITVKDEGFLALWKGVTPTIMGAMPYEGIKFGTVGILEKLFPMPNDQEKPSPIRKMLFGGLGGVMAGLITYPNDTVRRLLQLQGSRGTTSQYSGYWDCVRKTYRAEGITRFYRGLVINIVRMAPNSAVQFGSYELLKQWTKEWHF